jgi:hypothetical protein
MAQPLAAQLLRLFERKLHRRQSVVMWEDVMLTDKGSAACHKLTTVQGRTNSLSQQADDISVNYDSLYIVIMRG